MYDECESGVWGGQEFIPHTLTKIQLLRQRIDQLKLNTVIEVDGGITLQNARAVVEAGAHGLIAGTTIFNAADPGDVIHRLKHM